MSDWYWLAVWLAVAASGVWCLMRYQTLRPRWIGALLLLAGGLGTAFTFGKPEGAFVAVSLEWLFGAMALLCGALMVTSRNPVHGALWFALATLGVCGLFMLLDAPFLAAATIIVYAGAIIVVFMFVIMLVQQSGPTDYDARSHHPLLATAVSFVLLGALLTALHQPIPQPLESATVVHTLSHPQPGQPIGTMHGLGRSLFGNYLFAVELAGTLLLVASIGAIAIAPRREQGTL